MLAACRIYRECCNVGLRDLFFGSYLPLLPAYAVDCSPKTARGQPRRCCIERSSIQYYYCYFGLILDSRQAKVSCILVLLPGVLLVPGEYFERSRVAVVGSAALGCAVVSAVRKSPCAAASAQ